MIIISDIIPVFGCWWMCLFFLYMQHVHVTITLNLTSHFRSSISLDVVYTVMYEYITCYCQYQHTITFVHVIVRSLGSPVSQLCYYFLHHLLFFISIYCCTVTSCVDCLDRGEKHSCCTKYCIVCNLIFSYHIT